MAQVERVSELDKAAARRKGFGGRALSSAPMRAGARLLRGLLVRHARAKPRAKDWSDPLKLTIFTVSGWGKGGTTRSMLNLAEYMKDKREVEIIGLWRIRDEPFFEHPEGVPVYAADDLRPGHQPRGLKGLLNKMPSVLVHPDDRWSTSFSLLSDIRFVRKFRRRTGILVTTRPATNLLISLLNPPGLITIGQEQMHLGSHKPGMLAAIPKGYRNLDAFAVLTEGAREDYEKHLKGNVRVVRIPNSARDLGAPADLDAKRVLAAGRLTRQKGFDWLIPAWAQVEAKHPDWHLRVCGEGNWRPRLEAQVAEHGLKNIELPGSCADMEDQMSNASIFALSSRFEGFPLILCEAMSKGMAPVAMDCPTGPSEMIRDAENGLIVPLGDVDRYAAALMRMIEDDELRRRCGTAALETGKGFKMEAIGPMWDELFRELQEEARTAGRLPSAR
ncbi:MAG TPA: glycosyltransferase family 4 protein [Thermoleophilaceae bacterium]|nr:glycosyltransferase family 4 protein [Thermoleophilaceae bacterium]